MERWASSNGAASGRRNARERRQLAGHTRATALTYHAPLTIRPHCAARSLAGTAIGVTAIHDHRDVVVVLVVLHQLGIKLVG
jgi:hypothetical protein